MVQVTEEEKRTRRVRTVDEQLAAIEDKRLALLRKKALREHGQTGEPHSAEVRVYELLLAKRKGAQRRIAGEAEDEEFQAARVNLYSKLIAEMETYLLEVGVLQE